MAAITEQLRIPSIKKELARLEITEEMKRVAYKPNVAAGGWRYQTWLVITLILLVIGGVWFGMAELNTHARLSFITFGLAVIGWSFTKINDTYIAMAAAITLAAVGVDHPDEFFETLGDATIWLLLASFVIAAAVKASGLSQRMTVFVAARMRSVNQLFYGLTAVLMLTAFVIPATSGRAALMLPIFAALSTGISNKRIVRALALLFPTIILLSAVASLLGAGAHLVTAEIITRMTGEQIGFGRWLMLGLPFALVSCFGSTWIILRLFLTRDERQQRLALNAEELAAETLPANHSFTRKELYVLGVVALLVIFWSTESWHGLNNTIIAVLGALAITAPRFGAISFKDGIKGVEWNLVLFMAATLKLGEALIESGGAQWLVTSVFATLQNRATNSSFVIIAAVAILSLLSHLIITSRTARSSVLIPLVVLFAASLGFNPTLLAFLSTAAAGFCLTLPVCAKPAMMFSQTNGYDARDLLKLSGWLLPLHLILLLIFAFFVWPQMGLPIKRTTPLPAPTWQENAKQQGLRQSANVGLSAKLAYRKEK